jgi:hypothetical protein
MQTARVQSFFIIINQGVNVQTLCIILDFYMEQMKRSRDNNIHEYDDNKRKKISCKMIFHFVV